MDKRIILLSQWLGIDTDLEQKITDYNTMSTEGREDILQRIHGRHNPKLIEILKIASNLDNEYVKRICVPYMSVRAFKNTYLKYAENMGVTDDFEEFSQEVVRNINRNMQTEQIDTLKDICLFLYLFNTDAPSVLERITKYNHNVHAVSGLIYSLFGTGGIIPEMPDEKFKQYFLHILRASPQRMSLFLRAYNSVRDKVDDINDLTFKEIQEIIKQQQEIDKRTVADQLGEKSNPLLTGCMDEAIIRSLPPSMGQEVFEKMEKALAARQGKDFMPNIEIFVPLDHYASGTAAETTDQFPGVVCAAFRRIPYTDPIQYFLGYDYSCCYKIGDHAESAVTFSVASPYGGNYEVVILDSQGKLLRKLAQSFAWVNDERQLCFDNIEATDTYYGLKPQIVRDMYQRASNRLVEDGKVATVALGMANTEKEYKFGKYATLIDRKLDPKLTQTLFDMGIDSYTIERYLSNFRFNESDGSFYFDHRAGVSPTSVEPPFSAGVYSDALESQRILAGSDIGSMMCSDAHWEVCNLLEKLIADFQNKPGGQEQASILIPFLLKHIHLHNTSGSIDEDDKAVKEWEEETGNIARSYVSYRKEIEEYLTESDYENIHYAEPQDKFAWYCNGEIKDIFMDHLEIEYDIYSSEDISEEELIELFNEWSNKNSYRIVEMIEKNRTDEDIENEMAEMAANTETIIIGLGSEYKIKSKETRQAIVNSLPSAIPEHRIEIIKTILNDPDDYYEYIDKDKIIDLLKEFVEKNKYPNTHGISLLLKHLNIKLSKDIFNIFFPYDSQINNYIDILDTDMKEKIEILLDGIKHNAKTSQATILVNFLEKNNLNPFSNDFTNQVGKDSANKILQIIKSIDITEEENASISRQISKSFGIDEDINKAQMVSNNYQPWLGYDADQEKFRNIYRMLNTIENDFEYIGLTRKYKDANPFMVIVNNIISKIGDNFFIDLEYIRNSPYYLEFSPKDQYIMRELIKAYHAHKEPQNEDQLALDLVAKSLKIMKNSEQINNSKFNIIY